MHFMTIITVLTSAATALSSKGWRKPRVELLKVSEAQAVCGPNTSVRCCNGKAGDANHNKKSGLLGLSSTSLNNVNNCVDLSLNVIGILDGTLGRKCSIAAFRTLHIILFTIFCAPIPSLLFNIASLPTTMSWPAAHLPPPLSEHAIQALLQALRLPQATSISNPQMTAQYHSVYFLTLPPTELSRGYSELVLRVAGNHLPSIKTINEIGVMNWLSKNTTIPLPEVIAYDASTKNPIAHEYTLLSRIPGVVLSDIYDNLSDKQQNDILDQLIDFLTQLQAHPWDGIGGLTVCGQSEVQLGPVVDETFWQVPDIEALWPEGETVATLNIGGPYKTYVDYMIAHVKKYI
ncbi:hypothetical protein FMUND_15063 [Fusarium mundagurra]|uniref:Aminoglycoside phosphotransferase domain-containing protein n=1 Tax=Fusarium mundagurra TaxID=1567541 RepID=A0A8H5XS06_9HYPO|nr:hypothetical protein FMUND_15063 [Fusarium mundagurra]